MSLKAAAAIFLFLVSSYASAEDRFYPVIGVGGAITVIHSARGDDKKPSADSDGKPIDSREKLDTNERGSPVASVSTTEPASTSAEISMALYDSDNYTSSEELDKAISTEHKRRFYLIDNVLTGMQVEAETGSVSEEKAELSPSTAASNAKAVTELSKSVQVLTADEALERVAGLRHCITLPVGGADIAVDGEAATLILNKQKYAFIDDSGMLELYRLGGDGLRTLRARSYSSKDSRKVFASPLLALYDAHGCLVRVVSNYFDRFYEPTAKRHAGLGSELVIHAEERFLAVIAPTAGLSLLLPTPYESSATGQLTFSLVER